MVKLPVNKRRRVAKSLVGGTTELQQGKAAVLRTWTSDAPKPDDDLYNLLNRIVHNNDKTPHEGHGTSPFPRGLQFDHYAEGIIKRAQTYVRNLDHGPYATSAPTGVRAPPPPRFVMRNFSDQWNGREHTESHSVRIKKTTSGARPVPTINIPFAASTIVPTPSAQGHYSTYNINSLRLTPPSVATTGPIGKIVNSAPINTTAFWVMHMLQTLGVRRLGRIGTHPIADKGTRIAYMNSEFDRIDGANDRGLRATFDRATSDPAFKKALKSVVGELVENPLWWDDLTKLGWGETQSESHKARAPLPGPAVDAFDYSHET